MGAADAPYVPELQPGLEPVAGLGVPGLDNGYLPQMSDLPGAPSIAASQTGSLVEPPWRSLLGPNASVPQPVAQSPMGQHPLLRSSAGAGTTHVDNILFSLSHPRLPAPRALLMPQPGRAEQSLLQPVVVADDAEPPLRQPAAPTAAPPFLEAQPAAVARAVLQPAPLAPPVLEPPASLAEPPVLQAPVSLAEPPGHQPEARSGPQLEDPPQAPSAVVALRPAAAAAAAAAAASVAALRPAPPAGPMLRPPASGGSGDYFAPPPEQALLPPPVNPALQPRSAGAAAAARALAALAPSPAAPSAPPSPDAAAAVAEPMVTSAQEGHGLSNSAASSAARALSNLAGAAARAAAARTAPAGDSPPRTSLATSDGHGYDRHVPDGQGSNGQGSNGQGPGPVDFSATPAHVDEGTAATGPGVQDSDEPEVDPHLDDILPAKSKSFFRLRR
jgi:hypothetical protein